MISQSATVVKLFKFKIEGHILSFYQRFAGSELPKTVGTDKGNIRNSTGEPGFLTFGPYLSLEPGDYVATFYIRRSGPVCGAIIDIDVHDEDVGQLSKLRLTDSELLAKIAGQISLQFCLTRPALQLEARVFVEANLLVEILGLVIFSVDFKRWAS